MLRSKVAEEKTAKLAAIDEVQATIEFRPDSSVLTANRNFLQVMGYALEEIRGHHHSMFVDSAEREGAEYREFWTKLRRGESQAGKFKRLGKGGREVWIEASYNAFPTARASRPRSSITGLT